MIDRADILISHLIDGEATGEEWAELEQLAEQDMHLWREIAVAQRDHLALQCVVDEGVAHAEIIDVPVRLRKTIVRENTIEVNPILHTITNRLHAWSGWALAAMVMLAFGAQFLSLGNGHSGLNSPDRRGQRAGILANLTADEALDSYMSKGKESGTVIGVLPTHVLVETRPMPEGSGYEVTYLRRILERTIVPDLYEISGQDERGRPMFTRLHQSSSPPM